MKPQAKKEIRQFISVLIVGTFAALMMVGSILYAQTGGKSYPLSELLTEPNDWNLEKEGYSIEKITLSFFNEELKQFEKREVDPSDYARFYSLIRGDSSLKEPTALIKFPFEQETLTTLNVWIRIPKKGINFPEMLQEVQFHKESGYYRVAVPQRVSFDEWAYFEHNGIYGAVMRFLGGVH